ncbi:thiamine phosphate synthase [Chlorobium sp.]|uniref:thiamine phosphate synthase n=2 Tax=Chlorobium sp. TaxID=1095 RepID=UPI0025C26E14|nr:thiamine phosphate synthase [Chlorobium sp.]
MSRNTRHISTPKLNNTGMKKNHTLLPRIYIVSSGMEADGSGAILGEQLKLLPPTLACIIQIREKHLDAANLYRLCLAVKEMAKNTRALICLNERADIAAAAGVDGVHLQEFSCPPDRLATLRNNLLTGKSSHSLESALEAERCGSDYLIFGPVFDTPSKRGYGPPQGLDKLHAVCHAVTIPVYAIGGITPDNARNCLSAGAHGIAALSLFGNTSSFCEILSHIDRKLQS